LFFHGWHINCFHTVPIQYCWGFFRNLIWCWPCFNFCSSDPRPSTTQHFSCQYLVPPFQNWVRFPFSRQKYKRASKPFHIIGMSLGSDNNKLSFRPAIVPGISEDPAIHELNTKCSSPLKKVTRANVKMALTASQFALNKFIEISDRLSEFESRTSTPSSVPLTLSMWSILTSSRQSMSNVSGGCQKPEKAKLIAFRFSELNTAIAIRFTKAVMLRSRIW